MNANTPETRGAMDLASQHLKDQIKVDLYKVWGGGRNIHPDLAKSFLDVNTRGQTLTCMTCVLMGTLVTPLAQLLCLNPPTKS